MSSWVDDVDDLNDIRRNITHNTFYGESPGYYPYFAVFENGFVPNYDVHLDSNIMYIQPIDVFKSSMKVHSTNNIFRSLNATYDYNGDTLYNTNVGGFSNVVLFDPILAGLFISPPHDLRISPCLVRKLEQNNISSYGDNSWIGKGIGSSQKWFSNIISIGGDSTYAGAYSLEQQPPFFDNIQNWLNGTVTNVFNYVITSTAPQICGCYLINRHIINDYRISLSSCDDVSYVYCTVKNCQENGVGFVIQSSNFVINNDVNITQEVQLVNTQLTIVGVITVGDGSSSGSINLTSTSLNVIGSMNLRNSSTVSINAGSTVNVTDKVTFGGVLVTNFSGTTIDELFVSSTVKNITLFEYGSSINKFDATQFLPPQGYNIPRTTSSVGSQSTINYSLDYSSNKLVMTLSLDKDEKYSSSVIVVQLNFLLLVLAISITVNKFL
eukprot:TRINITY_DN3813_c0_g1_i1.p1 TRINITY_DN3813_c0_g1~~TRINITY_DN3813_c0_g1_i1.p1  ORF type:complete len:438 (+),score=67.79 TRINITY_DN3813_c0_g1_i1:558-1871(+)